MKVLFDHTLNVAGQSYELTVDVDDDSDQLVTIFTLHVSKKYTSELMQRLLNVIGSVILNYTIKSDEIEVDIFEIKVNNLQLRKLATGAELSAMKGLGRKLFCFSLRYFKTLYPNVSSNTTISLHAGGLVNMCDENFYAAMSLDQLLDRLKSRPTILSHLKKYVTQRGNGDEVHRFVIRKICEIESNDALIEYYKTYGFEPTEEEYDIGAEMRATYGTVIANCF